MDSDLRESLVTLDSKATDIKGERFSRFRLPSGQADSNSPDEFWRGPIDLTEQQLTLLATEIV